LGWVSGDEMPGRILIVDDNTDAANTLARQLAVTGQETRVAYDGFEALEFAATFPFDIAFIDIGMPGMNGYEAVRKLRASRGTDDLIMVALTAWSQPEAKQHARESGFDRHVVKPMSEQTLNELLAMLEPKKPEAN
jgi:CheY-like chemotaxis protein